MEAAPQTRPDLLIVDDDPLITDTLNFVLSKSFNVYAADSRAQVKSLLAQLEHAPELALIDLGLPPTPHRPDEGFRLITELLALSPEIKILVLSGQNDEANARHARALGAVDFVPKPCEPKELEALLFRARGFGAAERRAASAGMGIIGASFPITKLKQQIGQYASSPFPVLIEGESGSGKELVAQALHESSSRSARPYLALNCAAISPNLVEATLFGYSKGAFTGANAARAGYFEDAKDGTLFLDEIGELPLELQSKLLRVLENGEFQRVGETQSRTSTARVIAATNRDLRAEIKSGRFRVDLYHRLSVFTVQVPPLRELSEDKRLLLSHFANLYALQGEVEPFRLDDAAAALWTAYTFPGNVRELRNIVIRLTTKYAGKTVDREQLLAELDYHDGDETMPDHGERSTEFGGTVGWAKKVLEGRRSLDLDSELRHWEKCFVEAALEITHGNLSQAAKLLGMHRTTLYSRMQSYGEGAEAPGRSKVAQ